MTNEEKLMLQVDRTLSSNEKRDLLTPWELKFLHDISNYQRRKTSYSLGLSSKQKSCAFNILKAKGFING